MMLSMETGVSALDQYQQDINVIANNVANVNTVGYKESSVNFADTLSETIGSNAVSSNQVGTGVQIASITSNFSTAGELTGTGVQSDLAINGSGFFVVKDPTTGSSYLTQDGTFTVDANGYLINSSGMRLQGASGDLQISAGSSTATVTGYSIATNGTITVDLSDGTTSTSGQIALQNCSNPDALEKVGDNLYTVTTAAGALSAAVVPGASGTGTIESGYLEMSNVDLAGQLTDLITAQRAYEANSKVITTSNDMMQTLVNLIQG
jgi:flagellar hook protein FlgE